MAKLRLGPANERILKSQGPCKDNPTSMYHTSYASSFPSGVLVKRQVHDVNKIRVVNRPTGYNANFRPCIYYTPSMDDVDNPALKMNVNTHYQTGNDCDFKPYMISPTGEGMDLKQHDILPNTSGFTTMNSRAYIEPTSSTRANVYGKSVPQSRLFVGTVTQHDPIMAENQGTGPACMSTESRERFKGKQGRWQSQSWRFHKSIGHKEPTANTRMHPFDPIEYLSKNPYRHDNPSSQYYENPRPTGISEQQGHFVKHKFHSDLPRKGAAGISEPVPRSERNTGYSHETTKPRYTDTKQNKFSDDTYLSPNRSDAYRCTLARYSFTAPGVVNTQLGDGVGRRHVGNKEATGYVKNHPSYKRCPDRNNQRFVTHYMTRFSDLASGEDNVAACNQATLALSSAGWPAVNKASNGFTKSTRVHQHCQ